MGAVLAARAGVRRVRSVRGLVGRGARRGRRGRARRSGADHGRRRRRAVRSHGPVPAGDHGRSGAARHSGGLGARPRRRGDRGGRGRAGAGRWRRHAHARPRRRRPAAGRVVRERAVGGARRRRPHTGRDAAADQLTRRALVGTRCDRRRLVRRRGPPQVGLRRPAVLPHRSRPVHAGRSGRAAAGHRGARDGVRATGVRGPSRRRGDGGAGLPACPTVRPGRAGLVRRGPARAPELQRRPRRASRRRRAYAARGRAASDAAGGGEPRRLAGLRPGAAGVHRGHRPVVRDGDGRSRRTGVPQRSARARARAGPDRRAGAAAHRPRGHRPSVGLAAQQRRVPSDA